MEIWVANADGSGARKLTDSAGLDTAPTWSPTGQEIAFTSDRGGTPQIYLMDSEGLNVRRLTNVGNWNDAPAWNPVEAVQRDRLHLAHRGRLRDRGGGPGQRQVRQITRRPRELRVPLVGAQRPPPGVRLRPRRQVADRGGRSRRARRARCCRRAPARTSSPTGAPEAMEERRHAYAETPSPVWPCCSRRWRRRCSVRLRRQEARARGGHRGAGRSEAGTATGRRRSRWTVGPRHRSRRHRLGQGEDFAVSDPRRRGRPARGHPLRVRPGRRSPTRRARILERNAQLAEEPPRGQGHGRGPLRRARHRRVQPGAGRPPRAVPRATTWSAWAWPATGCARLLRQGAPARHRQQRDAWARNRRAHFAVSR